MIIKIKTCLTKLTILKLLYSRTFIEPDSTRLIDCAFSKDWLATFLFDCSQGYYIQQKQFPQNTFMNRGKSVSKDKLLPYFQHTALNNLKATPVNEALKEKEYTVVSPTDI